MIKIDGGGICQVFQLKKELSLVTFMTNRHAALSTHKNAISTFMIQLKSLTDQLNLHFMIFPIEMFKI